MAVVIRMARYGRKKKPFYRIVAADNRFTRDGRYLEKLGTYDPATKEANIDTEAVNKWVGNGAQMTATVKDLVSKQGATGA